MQKKGFLYMQGNNKKHINIEFSYHPGFRFAVLNLVTLSDNYSRSLFQIYLQYNHLVLIELLGFTLIHYVKPVKEG